MLQKLLKDEALHQLSHVLGSPLALGLVALPHTAAVVPRGWCSSGRDPGRVSIQDRRVRWDPLACKLRTYSRDDVSSCWQRSNITKVIFAGDSLMREQYIALQELHNSGSTEGIGKIKEGDFSWIRPDGVSVSIELQSWPSVVFNQLQSDGSTDGTSDVFITNLDAHWLLWTESDKEVKETIKRFAGRLTPGVGAQRRIFVSSVFVHSLRQRYLLPPRFEQLNAFADDFLAEEGFRMADLYNISKLIGNSTYDGMHLGEAASALTPVLLSMICEK